MSIKNLIKGIPFLLILSIITIITINNDNENTKLKFIIWNTPTLSVGRYIALSTASGFILSYIINISLFKANRSSLTRKIEYKDDRNKVGSSFSQEINNDNEYPNTLIERNIKDPSPTITASFRVIGRTNAKNVYPISNDINEESNDINEEMTPDYSYESDYQYTDQEDNYNGDEEKNLLTNDWEDDSYANW